VATTAGTGDEGGQDVGGEVAEDDVVEEVVGEVDAAGPLVGGGLGGASLWLVGRDPEVG
jgi:hypothetical protein